MDRTTPRTSLTDRTRRQMREALEGRRRGLGLVLPFFGPAVVTSVAYIDPGNFATNIQAGARYGYQLLWVVLFANLIAMLFQALSAKLGIVTGRNLAELCRERFPKPVVIAMWLVSEIAAMATDLAEFLGAAIGLALLLGMPLLAGMVVTAIVTYLILSLERWGFRPIELVIGGLVAVIALCYLIELFIAPVDWGAAAKHSLLPHLPDSAALMSSPSNFTPVGTSTPARASTDGAKSIPAITVRSLRVPGLADVASRPGPHTISGLRMPPS